MNSAEDIRLVLEPKSRSVDPQILMEQLFRSTELEARIPLNMNVLSRGRVPGVLSLQQVLRQWLDHRRDVLLRRSRHRLAEIGRRLEVLGGYLIAYLNIDEVIRIIRESEEPKPALMQRFELTDIQAEAILNMRLRALRKLEEIEIRKEHKALTEEKSGLESLLASEEAQWQTIAGEVREVRDRFGKKTELGRRRTDFATAPTIAIEAEQALIDKEPVTIVCSEKGWIRTLRGHLQDLAGLQFKEGDRSKFVLFGQTTDRLLLLSHSGKFFTLEVAKLPGGRGHGEPVRLMIDLEAAEGIAALLIHRPDRRLLLAASDGNGFIAPEEECLANTRKGKQVMNVKAPAEAALAIPVPGDADHLAVIGENRKLVIFPLEQVPEMARGRGVRLQKYKDGGLSDAKAFRLADGLSWINSSARTWTVTALAEWLGERAQAGRAPPKGFPRSNRFEELRLQRPATAD